MLYHYTRLFVAVLILLLVHMFGLPDPNFVDQQIAQNQIMKENEMHVGEPQTEEVLVSYGDISTIYKGKSYQTSPIPYDHDADGYTDYTMPLFVAQEIRSTMSCDALATEVDPSQGDRVYLPLLVKKPMLCQVLKLKDDLFAIVAVGFGEPYESVDFLQSTIVYLLDDGFIEFSPYRKNQFPISIEKTNKRAEQFDQEFPQEYWWPPKGSGALTAWNDISNMVREDIEQPSPEVLQAFEDSKKAAIEVSITPAP